MLGDEAQPSVLEHLLVHGGEAGPGVQPAGEDSVPESVTAVGRVEHAFAQDVPGLGLGVDVRRPTRSTARSEPSVDGVRLRGP